MAISMALVMSAGLAACGSSATDTADTQDTEAESVAAEEMENAEDSVETQQENAVTGTSIGADPKITVGYTLQQTGTFADTENLGTMGNSMIIIEDEDEVSLITSNGGTVTDVGGCSYLGNGYYILQDLSGEVNSIALYSADGTQLIPFEAADISWLDSAVDDVTEEQRYLKVIYSTGETDDEEEAFFYQTENLISLTVGDDDIMYTGYAKIYDTESRQFVSGVEITNSYMYAAQACGSSFVVEDEEGVTRLYDGEGNILLEKEGLEDVGFGYVIFSNADAYDVYDENGAYRFSSADLLADFDSTSGYMQKYTDDGTVLVDIDGEQVLSETYESYYHEHYGLFEMGDDTGAFLLVDGDGNVLASADSIVEVLPGYYYYLDEDGNGTIVTADGILAEGADSPEELAVVDGTTALVINDQTYSLELAGDYWQGLVPGIISVQSSDTGKYGVFDLFSGTQLLDYNCAVVYSAGDYLYAMQEDAWVIYEIVPVYAE